MIKYLKHSDYLKSIKKLLKADFVGWITEGDKKSLRIKIQGKDFILPLEGEEINEDTYKDLVRKLLDPVDKSIESAQKEIKNERREL